MDKNYVNTLLDNLLDSIDEMKNSIEEIKEDFEDEKSAPESLDYSRNAFCMSLADVDRLVSGRLSAIVLKPGDVIYSGKMKFKVIDVGNMKPINARPDEKHVLLRLEGFITDGTPFDKENNNVWEFASIRTYLNNDVFNMLSVEDQAVIKYVKLYTGKDSAVTTDRVFLLSAKELGLVKDEAGDVLPYFTGDEADTHRMYYDKEGDSRCYFTRSPYPGYAYGVRYVSSDGSLSVNGACSGVGAVPACVLI